MKQLSPGSLFDIANAAREADCAYNTVKRAIKLGKVIPFQREPILLLHKSEVDKLRGEEEECV